MLTTRNEAKKIAIQYIKLVNQFISVKQAYLFGSYANKKSKLHKWSDIDIAIISDDFEKIPLDLASKMLSKATQEISTTIEPVPIPSSEMLDPEIGTIGYTVFKHGIPLT